MTLNNLNTPVQDGLSILIPCLNEEQNVQELFARILDVMNQQSLTWEALMVDDGSVDSTWREIEELSRSIPRIKGIRHVSNQGIAAAWETALKNSTLKWVLTMDADLQFAPEEIPKLISTMVSGDFDVVQGKRSKRLDSRYRGILSAVFSWLLKQVFRLPFDDVKSGFVLYKREAFSEILAYHKSFRHFENWIIVVAHSLGFKIAQVDITVHPRNAGESYIKSPLAFAFRCLTDLPELTSSFMFSNVRKR